MYLDVLNAAALLQNDTALHKAGCTLCDCIIKCAAECGTSLTCAACTRCRSWHVFHILLLVVAVVDTCATFASSYLVLFWAWAVTQ